MISSDAVANDITAQLTLSYTMSTFQQVILSDEWVIGNRLVSFHFSRRSEMFQYKNEFEKAFRLSTQSHLTALLKAQHKYKPKHN